MSYIVLKIKYFLNIKFKLKYEFHQHVFVFIFQNNYVFFFAEGERLNKKNF